jgi:hypothetical protein
MACGSWNGIRNSGTGTCFARCDFTSPVYVAGTPMAAPLTIPLTFSVGVDENFAVGQGPELLTFFKLFSCTGTTAATCLVTVDSTSGVNTLVNENNGNGKSDGILTGFSTLMSGTHYMFQASWSNDTDGMEQFWLIPGTASVPEPGTIGLLGMGIVGLLGLGLRRKQV